MHTGLNSTKEDWLELSYVEELKKHFKVLLIDPRGHGESDKPLDLKKFTFEQMAKDVIALLDHLKLEKIHYFGYSLGGIVGWILLKYNPERFISMINGGSSVISRLFETNPFLRLQSLKEGPIENADFMIVPFNLEEILPNIKIPIMTFVGDKDPSCYPFVEEYSKLIPNCTTFTIKGLNHPETIMAKEKVLQELWIF